jgi:hypothetical protein
MNIRLINHAVALTYDWHSDDRGFDKGIGLVDRMRDGLVDGDDELGALFR